MTIHGLFVVARRRKMDGARSRRERRESTFARTLAFCLVGVALLNPQRSTAAEDFKGKTIKIVIGTAIGGSYGVYGQLVSRHLGKHIPGAPSVIVTAMPGAGGLVALNYLASPLPTRDGTTISIAQITLVQEALFNKDAKYDARDFKWIGRLDSASFLGMASKKSGIRTLEDARKREVITGSPGLSNIPAQAPLVLNKIAGTKFKLISGYSGTGQVFLALERGEVEVAVTTLASIQALHADAVKAGNLIPIFAHADQRLADFPAVPILSEFVKTDLERKFMNVFSLTSVIGRSLSVPPGTSESALATLREAYVAMMKDPDFQADAKRLDVDLSPMTGDDLGRAIKEAMDVAPADLAQMRQFYEGMFGSLK